MAKRKGGVNAAKSGKGKMKGGSGSGTEISAGAVMPMPMSTVAAWWASPWFVLFAMALAIIAFLIYLLWQKSQGAGEAKTAPIVVMSTPSGASGSSLPTATNHNLPINPQRDPKYPLRNTRSEFQQMGVLIAESAPGAEPTILPLIGKPAETHRDRWKYYTATDRYHMMRLPVNYQEKNCQEDVGCQEIYDGDIVAIPAYKDKVFTAQIYKYEAPRYDPSTI